MKTKFFFTSLTLLLLWNVNMMSQSTFACGTVDSIQLNQPLDSTFDVASIAANCISVYLNVQVHFFLEDDCSGGIGPVNSPEYIDPCQADYRAERLVEMMNEYYEQANLNVNGMNAQWHNTEWGLPEEASFECFPFRFVLKGVSIHCDSSIRHKQGESLSDYNPYLVDEDGSFNVFIADVNLTGFPSASGYTHIGEHSTVVQSLPPVDDLWFAGVFEHEFGHMFGLQHCWRNDGCSDTWQVELRNLDLFHDLDCDGNSSRIDQCWSAGGSSDTLDCNYTPCTNWTWQSNNWMGSTAWSNNPKFSATTSCQINEALNVIGSEHFDRVEQVGGNCPPPGAVISNNPLVDDLLFLNASSADDLYKVDIYSTTYSWITGTNWLNGPAQYYLHQDHSQLFAGQSYIARLIVENDCNDKDTSEVEFVQPNISFPPTFPSCLVDSLPINDPPFSFELFPNPIDLGETIYVDLELEEASSLLRIYQMSLSAGVVPQLLQDVGALNSGTHQYSFSTSNWVSGANVVIVESDNIFQHEIVIVNNE